jgi:hypothetical protein
MGRELHYTVGLMAFAVATSAMAQPGMFRFEEVKDQALVREARTTVISTGEPCPSMLNLWWIVQNGKRQPIFKAACSNQREYQITIIGAKVYVKPWTGEYLGFRF